MKIQKIAGTLLLMTGAAVCAFGSSVPEIDPATGGNALALVAGALLIYRSRRRK